MVRWYIETALSCGATSWSMEQVAAPAVISIMEENKKLAPLRVDFDVFNFSMLGVPQSRRRVLAGSPNIIAKLRRQCITKRPNRVCDFIRNCRGTHVRHAKNWKKSTRCADGSLEYEKADWTDMLSPITKPSPTIVASRLLSWVSIDNDVVEHCTLSVSDCAALQTFPRAYKLPESKTLALRMIGNAVPPFVAELLLCNEDSRVANSNAVVAPGTECKTRVLCRPGSPCYSSEKHRRF
jgi:site-specific DNA-cytosine methylase